MKISRRSFIKGAASSLFFAGFPVHGITKNKAHGNIIVILLEGGMDGLLAIPPIGDMDLMDQRSELVPNNAINLDDNELDPYINRGIAKESLGLWLDAKDDYSLVISRDKDNFSAMYNLANVEGSLNNWENARELYDNAAKKNPGFAMARSSLALADYELGNFTKSEQELRKLIRRYPTFADARAALTALTWSKGNYGEAESNWVAVIELDPRYAEEDWLLEVRRWPPAPVKDLMKFISLK